MMSGAAHHHGCPHLWPSFQSRLDPCSKQLAWSQKRLQRQPGCSREHHCHLECANADEAREAAAEKRRLREQHRNDRRVREQHASMLQSVQGLKHQVEAEVAVRRQLEADMSELKAKVGLFMQCRSRNVIVAAGSWSSRSEDDVSVSLQLLAAHAAEARGQQKRHAPRERAGHGCNVRLHAEPAHMQL